MIPLLFILYIILSYLIININNLSNYTNMNILLVQPWGLFGEES